uniref:uncharacterized protein LOC101472636 n=1 Tax=Maylandia zebra TaxID=106582 RepID=UPI000D31E18E|nr:uncharacterized protein LOC101472636 [Maylandia zebra]
MPEHSGMLHPSAKIRESISRHVWIKLTGPAAGSLTEAFCQNVAGLQENVSAKVLTLREAQKDDMTVPPTMIVMEGKAAGAQKYIKVEKLYRIVLLGNSEAVKSSLANAIFGQDMFRVDNTECQTESKSVHGRRITLINTPDLLCTNRSEEELKPEILRCITECTPGPHAFLIVLKVEKSTEQQQQAFIEKISQYFSEEVFKYATVVFTQDSPDSDEMKIKQFIDQNKYLSDLMRKCKSRYHIINKCNLKGDNLSSQSQVTELLNTIDQIVKQNKGVCYTSRKLQCGDTCSNNSVSKNDMIKLTGPASESVAKAFSGSAVVVLTPGSDVEEEIEKEDAKEELLGITEGLHRYLQGERLDMGKAVEYKMSVADTLSKLRTEAAAEEIFEKAMDICGSYNIQIHQGARHKQKRLEGFVLESRCGATPNLTSSAEFRYEIFFPCLDRMLQELADRFSGAGQKIMESIQACNPSSPTFLSEDALKPIAAHYHVTIKPEELVVAKNLMKRKMEKEDICDITTAFHLLDEDMFATLKVIFRIALTIPVSSCSCERSFSALRRLHMWLRRTMGQERLNDLAILSIENEYLDNVDPENVIDRFAKLKPRRYNLMLPQ